MYVGWFQLRYVVSGARHGRSSFFLEELFHLTQMTGQFCEAVLQFSLMMLNYMLLAAV